VESAGGTAVSGPISASEVASEALPVVGRLRSTSSAAKATRPSNRRPEWVGEGGRRRWSGRNSESVSKDGKVEQFHA
jgi:hypothetical protein